ncbi:MAG: D-alanine--D-alanine ligase [Cellvibrionaceae bacterium]
MTTNLPNQIETPVSAELRERLGVVGVLYGGTSAEREVSLQSGQAVLDALLKSNINAVGIDVNDEVLTQLTSIKLDRVFIVLHGVGGEDGKIQSLLSFLHLPYTGSGVQASALAMDKLLSKQLWNGIGLPTAKFFSLNKQSDWKKIMESLGGKVFVKPAHEGSSLGMSLVESSEELESAFFHARKFDKTVIAEKFLAGEEYTVTILNDVALPAIKLETDNQFYDYDAKYVSDDTRYLCPCGLSAEKEEELKGIALKAYQSLGCEGWARVDLMTDNAGVIQLLEVNTAPGMTSHSLVPMAAKAADIDFEELVVRILLCTEGRI